MLKLPPVRKGWHISQLDVKRTNKVEDAVSVGDEVVVKVVEIDDQGRINLSRKDALMEIEGISPKPDYPPAAAAVPAAVNGRDPKNAIN